MKRSSKQRKANKRRGSATVEMALVMPILLTMVFGMVEFGWMFTVRQAIVNAARAGAREASLPGSTPEDVELVVTQYLEPLNLPSKPSFFYELTRAGDAGNPTDAEIVHVSVSYDDVSLLNGYFGWSDVELAATCHMRRESME
jgi:hypothetical protein